MRSKLADFATHVRLTTKNRTFEPYVVPVSYGGTEFNFYVATPIAEQWYVTGRSRGEDGTVLYDSLEREITLNEFVTPGDVIFEVGGHHGFVSVPLAHACGPQGSLVTFEPMSDNIRALRKNVELNKLANAQVVEAAVGNREGQVALVERSNAFVEPSGLSLRRLANRMFYAKRIVPSLTIDGYCQQHTLQPTLLKIDVEGFEVAVLQGAQATLQTRPKIILEIHPQQIQSFGQTVTELLDLLPDSGYDYRLLWEDDRIESIDHLDGSQIQQRVHLFGMPNKA